MSNKKYTKDNIEWTDLTKKQRKFVEEYLKDDCPDQTTAADRAGYSTAASGAHACMNNAKVKAMIEKQFEEKAMSKNELLFRLSKWARIEPDNAGEKRVAREALGAMKELARRFDEFVDRKEVTISKEEKEKELDDMLGYSDIDVEEDDVVLEPMESDS